MSLVENIKSLCAKSGTSVPKLEKELGFGKGAIIRYRLIRPCLFNSFWVIRIHRVVFWDNEQKQFVQTSYRHHCGIVFVRILSSWDLCI